MGSGESVLPLLFYCKCLPISFLANLNKLLFWKKLMVFDNPIVDCFGGSKRVGSKAPVPGRWSQRALEPRILLVLVLARILPGLVLAQFAD